MPAKNPVTTRPCSSENTALTAIYRIAGDVGQSEHGALRRPRSMSFPRSLSVAVTGYGLEREPLRP